MMNGMSVLEQHTKVSAFIERWKDHGDEKQETQRFWIDLLQNVLGVEDALGSTMFEYKTVGGGFIDVLCPEARFLVEQKGGKIDLDKPEERQDTMVTPVQQALRYADALPFSMKPAVLCTCNFKRFRFYDLDRDPVTSRLTRANPLAIRPAGEAPPMAAANPRCRASSC